MMNQIQLFHATTSHQPHDQFLYYASFTPDLEQRVRLAYGLSAGESLADALGMYVPWGVQPYQPEGWSPPDFSSYFEDYVKPAGSFINGLGVLEIPAGFYHFTGYISPLRHAERIETLEASPYAPASGWIDSHMAALVQEGHAQGKVASTWVGHMYEDAWQIRGYEQFLMDMLERPEWCELILDRITEKNLAVACAAARAGVDVITTGDDVANQQNLMFSRRQWRYFMKSRWAKVYAAVRQIKPDIQIWYHSDGNILPIIPELIEIGVTILNPLQPECMDLGAVKRQFGRQIVLDGTIGTQTTMPFGTAADVKQAVRRARKSLGYDGALIFSPTHVLEPEVPVENIQAFIAACQEIQSD